MESVQQNNITKHVTDIDKLISFLLPCQKIGFLIVDFCLVLKHPEKFGLSLYHQEIIIKAPSHFFFQTL